MKYFSLRTYAWLAYDLFAVIFALWLSYALRLSNFLPVDHIKNAEWLFYLTPWLSIFSGFYLGIYSKITKYLEFNIIWPHFLRAVIIGGAFYAIDSLLTIDNFPRSLPIIFVFVYTGVTLSARLLVFSFSNSQNPKKNSNIQKSVAIYGAGWTGIRLLEGLSLEGVSVAFFIDDDISLKGKKVRSVPVYTKHDVENDVELLSNIKSLFVSIPSMSGEKKKEIYDWGISFKLDVKTVPSMTEIMSGLSSVTELRELSIDDLLGRDPVEPMKELIDMSLADKSILVTGAGGSIGIELCKQAIAGGCKTLVLFELSEFALYKVEKELQEFISAKNIQVKLVAILASVVNYEKLLETVKKFNVDSIYHAAAYKHVPLVEANPLAGIYNNVYGTYVASKVAAECSIERFVLISTDKAVRPTNVMGATKRLAELVVNEASKNFPSTIFTAVRFGNVLGSSGSVIPLFKKQIQEGLPLTVTHPDITRFFMTITEAVSLVIQAGSMSKGGEVFLLDMGEPVKITDLARSMILLSNANSEIEFIGLRPGEKLYEELLIGDAQCQTKHPKIFFAYENHINEISLNGILHQIEQCYELSNEHGALKILKNAVPEFVTA